MAEKLQLTDDPAQAVDLINNHDHTAVGTQIPTMGIADKAVTTAKLGEDVTEVIDSTNNVLGPMFRQPSTEYAEDAAVCLKGEGVKYYLLCVTAGTTAETDIDMTGVADGSSITDGTVTWTVHELANAGGSGSSSAPPNYYVEDDHWTTADQTKLQSPSELWLNINGKTYKLKEAVTIDTRSADAWDTRATERVADKAYAEGDYIIGTDTNYIHKCTTAGTSSTLEPSLPTTVGTTYNDGSVVWTCELNPAAAANRAGTDAYIFAVATATVAPEFVLSENSTVPIGYTADNSRKIGGFHCLCVDAGTNISDNNNVHPLSGYVAGDVLPAAVWDLKHRPKCDPEGMAYDEGTDMWYSIYLLSYTGAYSTDNLQLVSKYGGVIADGKSTEAFHPAKFEQVLATEKMRLPYQREFVAYSIGSNQATSIKGATDPTTTGGHVDSKGRRMISNIGLEDCCGVMWQYGADKYGVYTSGDYTNRYDSNDRYVYGKLGHKDYYAAMGGGYGSGDTNCGSRTAVWNDSSLTLHAALGARGASEPLGA